MYDNKLELIINVDAAQGNAEIKSVNRSLSGLEMQALSTQGKWGSSLDMMGVDAARSMGRSRKEMKEAGDAAKLLGSRIGIDLPRSVRRFIAESRLLGTVLSGLFKFGVFLAIGEALVSWVTRIGQKFGWWGEAAAEAKRKNDELTRSIREQTSALDEHFDRLDKLKRERGLIGLEGAAKVSAEVTQARADVDRAQIEYENLRAQHDKLSKQAQQYRIMPELAVTREAWIPARKELTLEAQKALKEFDAVQDEMLKRQQAYQEAQEKLRNLEIALEYLQTLEFKRQQEERLKNLKSYVDETRKLELSLLDPAARIGAQRREDIAAAQVVAGVGPEQIAARTAAINAKAIRDLQAIGQEQLKIVAQLAEKQREEYLQNFRQRLDYEQSLADQALENARQLFSYQEERAAVARDSAIRQLELVEPLTLEHKVALEAKKADIEVQYLRQVHDIKTALFDLETRQLITQLNLQKEVLAAAGQNVDRISGMISDIENQRKALRGQLDEQMQAAVDAARENAAIRQGQIIRDEQRRIFDSLKRQAEGVFDALLTRSQSVFSAIGNAFKTAMLTAIKEVITSHVARILMQMFGGLRMPVGGGLGAGSGGRGLGFAGALAGMAPILPWAGAGGLGGGLATPPFVPTAGGGGAGIGGLTGLAGLGGNLKEFLGFGGGVQFAPGKAATWAASSTGQKLSALGRSNAALLGGATLAMMGLHRGGMSGLAMTTAGGAMIGYKFGGPIGAAIGAGAGALAGTIRLFVKGAQEKAREKIRATYGVDIKDKGVLRQIVDMAKQGFGGNLDMTIRSQAIRDLVELYALTTGQSAGGLPARMTPASLVQSGGSLYQQSGFSGGLPGSGLDRIGKGGGGSAGATIINITVPGAKEFFEKETVRVVLNKPRAVQTSAIKATRANFNRRELTSLQLSPGTLTS